MVKVKFLDKRFIETSNFPVDLVNEASAREKGPGRPPHWEMVFWWTRKPLASARAIIAGALLPADIDPFRFKKNLRLDETSPHRHNPIIPNDWIKYFSGKKLLDPFAGFGSIPLEGLRLGLNVTAVELIPTAYVFLKAVLEYPAKYGEKLVKDVEKWGLWIIEQLRNDPIIRELYDPDVAVYIGSWEVKCPNCGKWTPLIGNYWLARVKGGSQEEVAEEIEEEEVSRGIYKRLAWMTYKPEGDQIKIEVFDLNEELKLKLKSIAARINVKEGKVIVGNRTFNVPKPNIDARRETATCLHCGNPIKYINTKTKRHYINKEKIPKEEKEAVEWYVKYALKQYNQGNNEIAKQKLLVKVKVVEGELKFEPCTEKDQQKLELARKEVEKMLREGDPDIPVELTEPYCSSTYHTIVWGIDKFYKLFNPRQLLTLIKLVKLIREAGKKIETEKQNKGQSKEEKWQYVGVILTYLAISLCKHVNYNSMTTRWDSTWWKIGETLSTRGIAMNWNWCDVVPFSNFIGSWEKSFYSMINGLKYICSANNQSNSLVFLDDATILRNLNNNMYNLVITDPPYYDDVPYSELSDFYYVWLKRALSDVEDGKLVPRFLPEAFFKRIGAKWVEIKAQWMEDDVVKREVSLNAPRIGVDEESAKRYFLDLLSRSFETMSRLLVDDGVLVTYYAHTDPSAWEALLEAGWRAGRFKITNAFPLITESPQRVTARGKVALDTSIIVVWRKGVSGVGDVDEIYSGIVDFASERALELIKAGRRGADLFIGTLASILGGYTRYEDVVGRRGTVSVGYLVKEYVYPATVMAISKAVSKLAGVSFGVVGEVKSGVSLFYLLAKILFARSPRVRRRVMDRSSFVMLTIGTRVDEKYLRSNSLVDKRDSSFHLVEPVGVDLRDLEELLRERGISISNPILRDSVDALHLLEYYAKSLPKKVFEEKLRELESKYSSFVNEALNMAIIFSAVLPKGDPERNLCENIVNLRYGEILERGKLDRFLR